MRAQRKYPALFLTLALVTGSVIAPLSHYLFMAGSEAYAIGHHDNGSHHGHTSDMELLTALESESNHCDYASLFASFSATPETNQAHDTLLHSEDPFLTGTQAVIPGYLVGLQSSRAPPVVI